MKCKDCNSMCKYRTSDGETECYYSQSQPKVMTRQEYNREISSQATCNWLEVRNQAAIAAMQAMITNNEMLKAKMEAAMNISSLPSKEVARSAILFANALVEQLKEG